MMNKSREKAIEARAYELWEKEGRPHGADERHWHQAIQELESTGQKKPAKPRAKKSASKSLAAAAKPTKKGRPSTKR